MTDDAQALLRIASLLVTAIEEIRGLRSDLAGRRAVPRTLSDADRVILAELLPAAARLFGDEGEFRAGLLMRRAEERGSSAKRAKGAIGSMSALSLGRLLVRAADVGEPIAGLHVYVVRPSRLGVIFCVSEKPAESRMASSFATQMRGKMKP
jgi:hypothetical protein